MTKKLPKSLGGKAAIAAGAIGSAAIAAALLYASKRKKKDEPPKVVPSGEKPGPASGPSREVSVVMLPSEMRISCTSLSTGS